MAGNRSRIMSIVLVAVVALGLVPQLGYAAGKKAPKPAQAKEKLVLMPLRLSEEDRNLQGAMETALVEGLQGKYEVFAGEQVQKKVREAFNKESAKHDCDETRCMQNIAIAFQAELIAVANITKQDGGYFLALSIQNIFDDKIVYSKSTPCKGCDAFAVVDKLKELSGVSAPDAAAAAITAGSPAEPIKINMPAVPVAPTVKGITEDADGQTWAEIIKGNTADDYKMYLDSFPHGKYAKQAAAQKQKLEEYAHAKAEADAAQAELDIWNKASQADTEITYNDYLKQYPTGPHAVLARIKGERAGEADRKEALKEIDGNMINIPGRNFEIGKYEVTQALWQAVMGSNPSDFKQCGANCPVENVHWNDTQEFIRRLNQKTSKSYRLPTEAEWEYACKAGQETEYCGGNDIDSVAWYDGNSNKTTHLVGQKQANAFGLYDMSGNVWEWVQDWSDSSQQRRVLRGGSWLDVPRDARADDRFRYSSANAYSFFGFRLARTLP